MEELKCTEKKSRSYRIHENKFLTPHLLDTPIYDEELMNSILVGIAQNIYHEMDKQGLTQKELAEKSGVHYSHLIRLFAGATHVGFTSFIKLANALNVSPSDLFPYDNNKRQTNGQRFDEITKEMDSESSDFLLGLCADFSREIKKAQRDGRRLGV